MKIFTIYTFAFLFFITTVGQSQATDILEIQSKVFNCVRKVKVSLPEGYSDYPNRKYNVIYLFDAQSDELFNYVKATIDYLMSNASIYVSPVILVGIQTSNRQFEFLPKNQTQQPLKDYFQGVKLGGADSLSTHLKDEVFPIIQKKYHCTSYRTGIGHSLGGTFLTYNLLKFPMMFNSIIAISPNYYYDNEQILHLFDNEATSRILDKKFLYIAYGYGDKLEERFKPATIKMDSLLREKNINGLKWQVQSLDNDSHATTPLEGIFKGLMVFNKELVIPDQQIERFYSDKQISFVDNLKKYYKYQSDRFNIQIPTIEDINHIAYNCFYSGKKKEAIDVLAWAISLYPDDTNLYDSMGEIQQETGNKNEALIYYTKGLANVEQQKSYLSPTTYLRLKKGFEDRKQSVKN